MVFSKKNSSGWILLEQNKKTFHKLNETAGLIWKLLERPITQEQIIECIFKEYDGSKKVITEDVEQFLKSYLKQKLIQKTS